jgi:DNA-binding MarR family transcriptional regulator
MKARATTSRPRRVSTPADAAPAVAVWVRLLKAHGLILRGLRRRGPGGLTLSQFDVLAQLARRPDGMRGSELTRELLVTAGNVTGLVARMARLGLVARQAEADDRRAARIRLTARGRRLAARAVPRHRGEIARLFAGLPERDLTQLRALLGRLNTSLEKTA